MKKSRLTDEQIVFALRQVESGMRCTAIPAIEPPLPPYARRVGGLKDEAA